MAERNILVRAWCERFNTLGEVSRIETMTNPHGETGPCCKVGAVAEAFELEGLDATLRERWIADEDRSGVRELADHVNVRLLESALRTDPEGALEGEAENYYRLLTDGDVSRGMRTEARNRLRDRGIDVGGIEERFVSHQTVYRHLTGCLGVSRDSSPADAETAVRDGLATVRALQRRTEVVATSAFERLDRDGHLQVGDLDVLVDVIVSCRACGEQFPLSESLVGRSCRCER
jgi:hypothetical protein